MRPFLVLLFLLAGFHALSLKTFPKLVLDEAVEANHAYNIIVQGKNVYSLFDDVFPPQFDVMRLSFPNTLRPFYNGALALFFRLMGVGPWSGRAFSLLCSFGSILLAWRLILKRTGSAAAALCGAAFLGVHFVFVLSAHLTRPEALLGLCATSAFYCLDGGRLFLGGLLAAAAVGVHTNGGGVALASSAVLAVRRPKGWPYFLAGAAVGATVLLYCLEPDRFIPGWVIFEGFFSYTPPYKTWGLNLLGLLAAEQSRFLTPPFFGYEAATPSLLWASRLEWAVLWGTWLSAWARHKDKELRSLLCWIGVWELFYALAVANKNPYYLSALEPSFVLLYALFLHRCPTLWRKAGAACLAAVGLAGLLQVAARTRLASPFDKAVRELRASVPRRARVLGPQQLWFAFLDQPYRDWDAAAYGKWLTGSGDVTRWVERWKPDYLITDCRFKDTFLKRRRLDQAIRVPMRRAAEIDVGRDYCDPFEVYRLDWPAP